MKKLVHFIEGLLIIFVIISPFSSLDAIRLDIDMQVEEFMNSSLDQNMVRKQEDEIKTLFVNNLSQEVKKFVESNSNFKVADVNISMREEDDGLLLHEVFVSIESEDRPKGQIKIDKIQISDSNNWDLENNSDDHHELKELLSQHLGIDKKSIYIESI